MFSINMTDVVRRLLKLLFDDWLNNGEFELRFGFLGIFGLFFRFCWTMMFGSVLFLVFSHMFCFLPCTTGAPLFQESFSTF